MASPRSKPGTAERASRIMNTEFTTAYFLGPDQSPPKGVSGLKLRVPRNAYDILAGDPHRMEAFLRIYGEAMAESRAAGRRMSFRVDIDPKGEAVVTPEEGLFAEPGALVEEGAAVVDPALEAALSAARERGRSRAAEILSGEDMLSAEDFARMLGTTRVTVNAKRLKRQVLALDGAKRGFRFPIWQINPDGKPFAELAELHDRLGGPWAVYRFLVQPHGEIDGLTGREALERGRGEAVLEAAESVGRDFR